MMSEQRYYIAIDLKSFYASVECIERGLDPLTANLVVADRSRTEKTICLAVTPSLKKYGLSGRCRLFEVEQKVEEIYKKTGKKIEYITAEPRMALYEKYSADIYSIYIKFISPDDIHVYSVDEVMMDITDYLFLYQKTPYELAKMLIKEVYESTGITATAGIGTNLYLCKVAMDIVAKHISADKDGVRIAKLNEMSYRKLLWDHRPLTDFWRTGPGIARKLEKNGIHTMGELARVSTYNEDLLYRLFGIDAEILIDHAWGYEPCTMEAVKSYRPKTNSFSSGQVLKTPYTAEKARIVVSEMTQQLVLQLVEKHLATASLTLTIGYDRENVDNGNYSGEIHIDRYGRKVPKSGHGTANVGSPTSSTKKLTEAVLELYDRIVDPRLFIRRLTLNANKITGDEYVQMDLFTDVNQLEKEKKIQQTMLGIQKRFGKNAIIKGTSL